MPAASPDIAIDPTLFSFRRLGRQEDREEEAPQAPRRPLTGAVREIDAVEYDRYQSALDADKARMAELDRLTRADVERSKARALLRRRPQRFTSVPEVVMLAAARLKAAGGYMASSDLHRLLTEEEDLSSDQIENALAQPNLFGKLRDASGRWYRHLPECAPPLGDGRMVRKDEALEVELVDLGFAVVERFAAGLTESRRKTVATDRDLIEVRASGGSLKSVRKTVDMLVGDDDDASQETHPTMTSRTEEFGAQQRGQTFKYMPEDLVIIDDPGHPLYDERVDQIDRSSDKWRKFRASIAARGVINAISIKKGPERKDKPGTFLVEVVDGRQRVLAAREVNKMRKAEGLEPILVEAVLRRGDEADMVGLMIASNEHRIEDTPLIKAKKAKRALDFGSTETQICNDFGWSKAQFKAHMDLLSLAKPVREAIDAGRAPITVATELAKLDLAEQKAAIEKIAEVAAAKGGSVTGQAAREAVRESAGKAPRTPMRRPPMAEVRAKYDELKAGGGRGAVVRGQLEMLAWVLGIQDSDEAAAE